MSQSESSAFGALYFPLASNAQALVAGSPVESVRARLKLASVLYDRIYLEGGSMAIHAGPGGSSAWRRGPDPEGNDAWQTARARSRSQRSGFVMSVAAEISPGTPAPGPFMEVINSSATIAWAPTFHPFSVELPADCDWVAFVKPPKPSERWVAESHEWKSASMSDPALTRLIPVDFVRSHVLDDANSDLGAGESGRAAVSIDSLHARVISSRFADDSAVKASAFALPILVPGVRSLPWERIATLRKTKAMTQFREVLREVEEDAMDTARSSGDIERQVNMRYRKRLTEASAEVDGLGAVVAKGTAELLIGMGIGYATMGLALLGPLVGALPGVASTAWESRKVVKDRRRRAWVGVAEMLEAGER